MRQPEAEPFLDPVDTIKYDCPNYYEVIKHPIDLRAIARGLAAGAYVDLRALRSDLGLVFSNAFDYNPPENEVFRQARELQVRRAAFFLCSCC